VKPRRGEHLIEDKRRRFAIIRLDETKPTNRGNRTQKPHNRADFGSAVHNGARLNTVRSDHNIG